MVKPRPITISTEPIGRIPRPVDLIKRVKKADSEDRKLAPLHDAAVRDLTEHIEGASSLVLTDGEQRKHHNFGAYRVHGLSNSSALWLHDSVTCGMQTLGGTVNL